MKLTYTPVDREVRKNLWTLVVEYSHGDADAETHERYDYHSEEEFIKAATFLKKLFDLHHKYHNLFCDLKCGGKLKAEYKAVQKAFGKCTTLREFVETNGFEMHKDVTSEDYYQCPRSIEKAFHYDKDGNKFRITWK
jgi:hypothetical protein